MGKNNMNRSILRYLSKPGPKLGRALILLLLSLPQSIFASSISTRNYEAHPGYLANVENEKNDSGIEIPFIARPSEGLELREKIFNSELSKEFKDRYEDKFGRTEPERVYNSPNKYTYYDDLYTLQGTPEQVNDQKRQFGEYMMRRLVEYHADRYAKSDPQVRPIYEAKERLSQIKVEVQQVKFDAKYSLAGNILDLRARSPWFDTKVSLILAGANPTETIVSVTKEATPSLGLEARYLEADAKIAGIITKKLSPLLTSTLTASACTGDSQLTPRETLYLVGMSLLF